MISACPGPEPGIENYERLVADLLRDDPQARAAAPRPGVRAAALRPGLSLAQSMATIMEGYADRPALGERVRDTVYDQATGVTGLRLTRRFAATTYGELWSRAGAIAAAWHGDPRVPVRPGDFVATLGFASGDYLAIELASIWLGAVSVPLPAGAAPGSLRPVIAETGARVLAVSVENLPSAVEAAAETVAGGQTVTRLVVFDYADGVDAHRRRLAEARVRLGPGTVVDTLDDVVAVGAALPAVPLATAGPAGKDPLSLLVYTSGSTGTPKGAMYTQRLVKNLFREYWSGKDHPVIGLHFTPMNHIMGRLILFSTLAGGGTVYFAARPDLSTLLEDYELTRPTELVVVPRVCDLFFQHFQRELGRRAGPGISDADLEAEVKDELRGTILGGRVVWAACGSAPLSAGLAAFTESVLGVPVHDAYGSTETGAIVPLRDGRISPWVQEYRLADVPELGYFRTDVPHPRGELLLKSDEIVPGYFNRPDATATAFDAGGFYRTGDIMAEVEPGRLRYIDRRNNVLKLSQGEFVALSRVESVFAGSPLVRQIYVYGNSEQACLLAVVVPTPEALERFGGPGHPLKTAVAGSLRRLAKDAGLSSYEVPRDILVETEPFTVENGFLSTIRKLARPQLDKHYGPRLEALYAEIAEREASELRRLRESGRGGPVSETVTRAARALLGASGTTPDPDAFFTDLGGDSLSAQEFSALLRQIYGVEVPVSVVIGPAGQLRGIADYIERSLRPSAANPSAANPSAANPSATRPAPPRPGFAAVHGADAAVVRAADLTLEKFLDAETLARATALPPAGWPARDTGAAQDTGAARTVLLTGANGYLGRFLCLEWLERMAETGGRLVCVVRGRDRETARARLDDAFGGPASDGTAFGGRHGELPRRFRELSAGRLEVLPGDVAEPRLGLGDRTWHELAESVDLIVHPAALVNHVLPYQQLFGPNVTGTAEVIRLALTTRIKPVNYVSTVAVVAAQASAAGEDRDIRAASPERVLDDSYANGYATSKWAGEVLLRQAHGSFGLPVAVFRPDMILAHTRYPGQLNAGDMFTRLLLSLLATGIAPGTFYGGQAPAPYGGLPVDFVAEAVTSLGGAATAGYRTYNVRNPHEDGASLNTFVDWLTDADYPISRIDDYATWLHRFETAIRALPDRQRQHSLLPLLHAFAEPAPAADGPAVPSGAFQQAARALRVGSGDGIPHITPALIRKYPADLKELHLI